MTKKEKAGSTLTKRRTGKVTKTNELSTKRQTKKETRTKEMKKIR
jgi:hypothetical protein